jgi:hypothetical protein
VDLPASSAALAIPHGSTNDAEQQQSLDTELKSPTS